MDLDALRAEIDRLDREIIVRINERIGHACEIGRIKHANGKPTYVPSREEEVFRRLQEVNQGPLPEDAIRHIFREIISVSRAMEEPMVVAYLGPASTYNHQAAIQQFGSSVKHQPVASIPDVFTAVERGEAHYGVVPLENSSEGAVFHSYDSLVESDLKIVAQTLLKIEHCLISEAETLTSIREVHSHPQALGQCRDWLRRNLPEAQLIAASSTARAVQKTKGNPEMAAIAGSLAAEMYTVPILSRGIQDMRDNMTRFLVIGDQTGDRLGNGRDKTSLVLTIHNKVGALQQALAPFSSRGIDLTKIESRPSRKKAWDYYFFIDLIGHVDDETLAQAIDEARESCPLVKWLGSYPA